MGLTLPGLSTSFAQAGAAHGLTGPAWLDIVTALSISVPLWLRAGGVPMAGLVIGTAGAGRVYGKAVLLPAPGVLATTLAGNAMLGAQVPLVAGAVAVGFAQAVSAFGAYAGVSTTAIGPDTSKAVAANAASLAGIIAATGRLKGASAPSLISGLSSGIAAMALTTTGNGAATGVGSAIAAAGASNSFLE